MRIKRYVAAGAILASALPANAQDETTILKQTVEELQQRVRILERKEELTKEAAAAVDKSKAPPTLSLGAGGLTVQSADSNFVLRLRGYVQADGRFFFDDVSPQNDTFLLRRVRPIFEGTVFEKYDYRLMLDFGSGVSSGTANNGFLQDGYVNARFLPEFQVQVGKFKEPVGLERLQSGANLLFAERAYPTQLVPHRDVGVQIHGGLRKESLNYAVGVFNGVADGGSGDFDSNDDDKDFAARIFAHPFKNTSIEPLQGFGIGVAGTFGNQEGALRNYSSPGQQRIFSYLSQTGTNVVADGEHWRISPQFYYYWGPFGLLGEYAISSQELRRNSGPSSAEGKVEHKAWQLAASYFITGEANSFRPVAPRRAFAPGENRWGALELAARVSEIDFDDDAFPTFANPNASVDKAFSWAVGLNWYLNRNIKVTLDYEQTRFDGGGNTPLFEEGERVVFSRVQFSF